MAQLLKGVELNGRRYKNLLDGANQLDYISGKSDASPRSEFIYVNDDGQIVAMRYQDWKASSSKTVARPLKSGVNPSSSFACRCSSTSAATRSRNPSTTRTPTTTGSSTVCSSSPRSKVAANFLMTMQEYPPSQTPGSFNLEGIQKKIEPRWRSRAASDTNSMKRVTR